MSGKPRDPARWRLSDEQRATVEARAAELPKVVGWLLNRYGSFLDAESAADVALDALMLAVRKFDPARGVKLGTFWFRACQWLLDRRVDFRGKDRRIGKRVPLAFRNRDGEEDEQYGRHDANLARADSDDLFERLARLAGAAYVPLIREHFRDGVLMTDIARRLGLTRSAVAARIACAVELIARRIPDHVREMKPRDRRRR